MSKKIADATVVVYARVSPKCKNYLAERAKRERRSEAVTLELILEELLRLESTPKKPHVKFDRQSA